MRGARFDYVLTGAVMAVALAMTTTPLPGWAQSGESLEAAMPAPDTTPLPPPTIDDIAAPAAAMPVPDTSAMAPPTVKDIGPATATADKPAGRTDTTAQPAAAPAGETSAPAKAATAPATSEPAPALAVAKVPADAAAPKETAAVPAQPAMAPDKAAPAEITTSSVPSAADSSKLEPEDASKDASKDMSKDAPKETAQPAIAPAAPPSMDAMIAERLRELAAGKFDRVLGGKRERTAIEPFYSSRDFAPLWITGGVMNERAKAAAAYLAKVDADGLDPADYPVPAFKADADAAALAEAEVRLTDAVLTFARHAEGGRVHYSRVAGDILYNLARPDPAAVLARLAAADDAGKALDSFNPPQPGYKALKAKLAEARHTKDDSANVKRIAGGPVLRYGKTRKGKEILMQDERVPLLRERLGLKGDADDTTFDKAVADAVAKFQRANQLAASGQLTAATVDALNGRRRDRDAEIIIANMERWRWMPRDLGKIYVMVNIPDYSLRVIKDNKLVWSTKVVVGKPSLPTPITSAEMKFITVNPTWNVPPSIIQNEYLPALRQDPQAMERIGLKVSQNPDGTVRIWQPPGDRNALGRIRFNFPNKFLVYQHDTPDKHLFAHDKRAYSHGCMRVENPLKYGEVLLSLVLPREGYTQERLHKMFGGSEININFPTQIPVHLTYQTAFVDDGGKLQIRDDVYGRDARTLAALNGDQRKVADIPVDRPKTSSSAPVRMPPGTFGSQSYGSNGPSFFEMLFGGRSAETVQPRQQRSRAARANERNRVR